MSNLDLADLVAVEVESGLPTSLTAWEFSACFPGQLADVKLSAAARMSASFPFVTPAGQIPSDPPVRVVDAAYYDNYGINLAASVSSWQRCSATGSTACLAVFKALAGERRSRTGEDVAVARASARGLREGS